MGPSVSGLVKERVGKPRTLDDGRPAGFYVPRFRNLSDKNPNFIRGYGFEGMAGTQMFPGQAEDTPGFGAAYKKKVRDFAGAYIEMGGFGEVLARYENQVALDPVLKDKWGIPVIRFNYKFGDNEKRMCVDMANAAQEMFEEAGFEILNVDREVLTEGWSIHELGTARMGTDKKTSVLNQFQQSHDVRNLFIVDGSSHVSASCQNPTWTIMALAWRSCEHLADEFRGKPLVMADDQAPEQDQAPQSRRDLHQAWRSRHRYGVARLDTSAARPLDAAAAQAAAQAAARAFSRLRSSRWSMSSAS